ncbi:hypothetical protein [Daejeonella lutea]|uniref:Lipoprotein n=1 Tax=Daejeonella lutea TaxID=572036 RepID=A0A1T5BPG5_9SPHI|nr:hypothetical protein [Daejeonella lutea]SKB49047.1 hypothetical protein SAMN05661099_1639 [Daejeonella lutea]
MKNLQYGLITSLLLITASCDDKAETGISLDGNYSGYFYHIPPGQTKVVKAPAEVNIKLDGSQFAVNGTQNRYPAGGSGTFSVINRKEVDFKDENFWTADFDWNLILNGRYSYEIKSDSLILTRTRTSCPSCDYVDPDGKTSLYQYRLGKVNVMQAK